MAAHLTDRQKKKIVADYLETQSVNATAKRNGVSWGTAKIVLEKMGEIEEKLEIKKQQNTADILAYMEQQKDDVKEVLRLGMEQLKDPEKLAKAQPREIATTMAILIDKYTAVEGTKRGEGAEVKVIIDV